VAVVVLAAEIVRVALCSSGIEAAVTLADTVIISGVVVAVLGADSARCDVDVVLADITDVVTFSFSVIVVPAMLEMDAFADIVDQGVVDAPVAVDSFSCSWKAVWPIVCASAASSVVGCCSEVVIADDVVALLETDSFCVGGDEVSREAVGKMVDDSVD